MTGPNHDEIASLARAYRDEHDGTSDGARATRDAVLRESRRRRERGWILAAAVLLVTLVSVPTAWALYTGRLSFDASDAPIPHEGAPARTTAEPAIEAHAIEAPTIEAPVTLEPEAPALGAAEPSIEAPVPLEANVEPMGRAPIDPAERRAYEEAHALHFDAHDAAGAVEAWDRYLSRYPRGRFAPEARYNRALSLVRLDRRDEAIEALRPFTRGTYRREEATALLEALGATP